MRQSAFLRPLADLVHNLFERPPALSMLDSFPQPAAKKRFKLAFFSADADSYAAATSALT
ncbi:hypothetical protein [Salinibacter sp.]|uniref:hypothetical protein n=1 Tax=Salinibacter sp. TaxID=2065818 RepID=UPI0021E9928E|nr:hypothetical protein [Salinibacter sp.]